MSLSNISQGGAGTELTDLINDFSDTNNYVVVNQGQLKEVARPFYDRLGMSYPWPASTSQDYVLVNIGQAKALFDFEVHSIVLDSDGDGMPDTWETAHGLDPNDASDALEDLDGDQIKNLDEYRYGLDPLSDDRAPGSGIPKSSFVYDAINRLEESTVTFTYDAEGNVEGVTP